MVARGRGFDSPHLHELATLVLLDMCHIGASMKAPRLSVCQACGPVDPGGPEDRPEGFGVTGIGLNGHEREGALREPLHVLDRRVGALRNRVEAPSGPRERD